MKRVYLSIFTILTLVFLAACSDDSANGTKEKELSKEDKIKNAAMEVIELNEKYAEEEKLDDYMSTLSAANQSEEARMTNKELFDNFDIEYKVSDINFTELTDEKVVVELVQEVRATDVAEGYAFTNSSFKVKHTLVKEDGEFKFDTTEIIEQNVIEE